MVEGFKFMFALRSRLGDTECEGCEGDEVWGVVNNMTRCECVSVCDVCAHLCV